ncbi:MAG: hypothetical protein F9K47_05040 [Burkholderiales bacterium]|nr:MAG: hypothetical protein F9K47_05040 [Burkholderiales bacterium]
MKIDHPHLALSILCFAVCLALPAYYLGDAFEPQGSASLLLTGWLGPFDGHFSWYANPLYLLALVLHRRPRASSILALIALALAASFLLHNRIAVSEAPTYQSIVAYGWGYALWLTAMATLSVGQWLRARGAQSGRTTAATLACGGMFLAGYLAYYLLGGHALFGADQERDRAFAQLCATAGEQIYKKADDVRGIFFDPDWEQRVSARSHLNTGTSYASGSGVIGLGHLNQGQLAFYETRDRHAPEGYLQFKLGDFQGAKVHRLASEYAVISATPAMPPRLNILGGTVTIKDLRDSSVLATATFFLDQRSGKFCGNSRGAFSTSHFVTEVLGLKKKYASVAK